MNLIFSLVKFGGSQARHSSGVAAGANPQSEVSPSTRMRQTAWPKLWWLGFTRTQGFSAERQLKGRK